MSNPKVLFTTYLYAFQIFGGAEIQLLKTKEYLDKNGGCDVKLFDIFNDRIRDFDILHNFLMFDSCLPLARIAKEAGTRFALSPIYIPPNQSLLQKLNLSSLERLYTNVRQRGYLTSRDWYPYKEFLELADIILPNSQMEADRLSNYFKINREKFQIVPNGVDERFASGDPNLFVEKYGLDNFVLHVARIYPVKNTLRVIKACMNLNLPLVIIGKPGPGEEAYFEECKKIANSSKNIHFIDFLPHDSEELRSAYAAAKVFVLPSLWETCGLVALEAGLAGCNVVITNRGATKEYFREHALYVDPLSIEDITSKVKQAYEQPKTTKLKELISEEYTWKKVAEKTLTAYKSIFKS
jgi:glycosyltransferase involved in cell wall biosynthesis